MSSFNVETVDRSILTPIVRRSLSRPTFEIQDWHVSQLGGGAGNPVSLGLYRMEGTGQDQGETLPWSIILKVIQSPANMGLENMGEQDDPTHWNYWKREPLVYQSGLLENLPGNICAPRYFGVAEMPGDIIWLWLEDVSDSHHGAWSLDRYALTARHLGQLNGSYLEDRSLASFPFFSRRRIRQWINLIPWQTIPWEHPTVLERYPRLESNFFQRMLADNERFLTKLEQIPQTLCHGDTYPTNFMARDLPDGLRQTVALDWALAGIGPIGADLGQLVFGAQNRLGEIDPGTVDRTLFESYIDGLRDRGCTVELQVVRFGYTTFAALQVGLFAVYLLNMQLEENAASVEQSNENPVRTDCFEVIMADEAYRLLDLI